MEVTPYFLLMLFITYSHADEKFACDGNYIVLKCNSGGTLNITSATYGRLSNKVCPDETLVNFKPCQTKDAYTKIKTLCDGEEICIIKANSLYFGDACPQISKYLNIKYYCRNDEISLEDPDVSEEHRETTTTEEPDISIEIETRPPNYKLIPLLNPNYVTTPKPRPVPSRVFPAPRPVHFPIPNYYPAFNRRMNIGFAPPAIRPFPAPPAIRPFPAPLPLMPFPLFG